MIETINKPAETKVSRMELHKPQTKVFRSRAPITLDMAGQRGGKSQMIGILSGMYIRNFPKLKGFIAANTYDQLSTSTLEKAFEIWRDLFGLTQYHRKNNPEGDYVIDKHPPEHFKCWRQYKDYHNIISFKNGHVIYVGSLDNYKAHDGKEFAYAHLDETKDTKEVALTSVILARLSQRGLFVDASGNLVYVDPVNEEGGTIYVNDKGEFVDVDGMTAFNPVWIHTSPAVGQVDWLIKMFGLDGKEKEILQAVTDPNSFYHDTSQPGKEIIIYSTYWNEANLPENYIAGRLAILSENEALKFVYGYPFSRSGDEFHPSFNRIKHTGKVDFIPGHAVHCTWDFNVRPYMTMIAAQIVTVVRYRDENNKKYFEPGVGRRAVEFEQVRFYREYCYKPPDNSSERIVQDFKAQHFVAREDAPFSLFIYGDASGRNRIEGLGSKTRFDFVEDWFGDWLGNGSNRVKKKNMEVLTRRDLMARIFEDKYDIEILFDSSLEQTIRDFEFLKLGPKGKLKEKDRDGVEKIGHTSDAVEYIMDFLFGDLLKIA